MYNSSSIPNESSQRWTWDYHYQHRYKFIIWSKCVEICLQLLVLNVSSFIETDTHIRLVWTDVNGECLDNFVERIEGEIWELKRSQTEAQSKSTILEADRMISREKTRFLFECIVIADADLHPLQVSSENHGRFSMFLTFLYFVYPDKAHESLTRYMNRFSHKLLNW